MVAEPWLIKMGNQVSSNLKQAFLHEPKKAPLKPHPHPQPKQQTIGILSFEVANVLSKTIHLHKSLTDTEISKLKTEILKSEAINNLVVSHNNNNNNNNESYLLELALAEKLDELDKLSNIVSRLGKKCTEPALLGFEHVYADLVSGAIDVKDLGFLVKDMDSMVKKMERYVSATANLYSELEVLNELEQGIKKFQHNQHEESRRAFEQKLIWQKQDVRHLKEVSVWNQTYDKVVELLVRTVCTIFARICFVFGGGSPLTKGENRQAENVSAVSGSMRRGLSTKSNGWNSGPIERPVVDKRRSISKTHGSQQKTEQSSLRVEDFQLTCAASPGRLFMDCLSLSSSASKLDDDDDYGGHDDRSSQFSGFSSTANGNLRKEQRIFSCGATMNSPQVGPKSRVSAYACTSTIGGSALALHYANVIIVIEKFLRYPHLVGEEARDDLYQMLPTSLRMSLKTNLKSYIKNLAIYDAPLAHAWKENLDGILKWLGPLAHNMIRWQNERNFEQLQIASRTNVLLLQTLYFADRKKTEAAICELLVGLNYICRYEHQQNALLDCASSFDFEDCMQWQQQYGSSYID
ncbi:hypothetical protein ACFE04_005414 [Oxalis oulophora]